MSDPWQDKESGGENEWDEGRESIETDLEDGFDHPEESDEDDDHVSEDDVAGTE